MNTLIGIAGLATVFAFIYYILSPWDQRRKDLKMSRSWPTVAANVVETSSRTYDGRGLPIWWVDYSYEVGGYTYKGRMGCVSQRLESSSEKPEVRDIYPAGARICVRYDPANPSRSIAVGNPK